MQLEQRRRTDRPHAEYIEQLPDRAHLSDEMLRRTCKGGRRQRQRSRMSSVRDADVKQHVQVIHFTHNMKDICLTSARALQSPRTDSIA